MRFSSRCIPIHFVDFSVKSLPIPESTVFPIFMEYSERFCFICLGLRTIYLVLTRFNDKRFEQTIHINEPSIYRFSLRWSSLRSECVVNSLVASANDKMAPSQALLISLTSSKYNKGPIIEPCGTPVVIGTLSQ